MILRGYRKYLLFILMLFSAVAFAQNNSITGSVADVDNKPISFVNVVVNKAISDEEGNPGFNFLKGTSTDDLGNFTLDGLEDGTYLISFIYLGYHVNSITVAVNGNVNLGKVQLEESIEDLDEAVVVTKRPTIRKEPGKLVFNVEGTSLATGNVVQLLAKTPGVLVTPESITVKNVKPVIYINNKRVYLSSSEVYSLLNNTDATIIKSVEVITNPGAQYDAEGSSVLNIVTSRAISIGYKGSVSANYQQAVYSKYAFATSHFYKKDWLSITGSYTFSPRKEFKDQEDMIRYFDPFVQVNSIWAADFQRVTRSYGHQGNLTGDFALGEKHTLSLSADIFVSPDTKYDNRVDATIRNAGMRIDSTFITLSFLNNTKSNLSFSGTHTVNLDEKGSNLRTAVNYILYDDEQFQEVASTYFDRDGSFLRDNSFFTNALQDSDIVTAQSDLSLPLDEGDFSMGIKYSNIDTNSSLDFFNTNSGTAQFQSMLSDAFLYKESIYAGYLDYSASWGAWALNLGIRAESTDIEGTSVSLGMVNNQNYFELFPSVSLDYTMENSNIIGISYARRITRPRYQSLNPFKYFLNENNFNAGNPNLVPSIDNKIKLSYSYKNQLFFDLYYHHTDNVLSILTFQDNLKQVIRSVDSNLIQDFQYSLDVLYAASITPWWYLSVYTSGFYFENEFYAVESVQKTYSNSTFGFYGQLYSGFTIAEKQNLTADLTTVYLSDYIYGSYFYGDQLSLSISVQKKFWNNRARLTVGVEDIFNTYNVPIRSVYYNQDNSYFPRPESRLFRLGFTYSFGNIVLKENNRRIRTNEAERLEKQ